jgi:hypothetical protein
MQGLFAGNLPIQTTVPSSGLIAAAASGVIVTLFATLVPAWDVTRITPMQALRPLADDKRREGFFLRHSWQIGLGLMALAMLPIRSLRRSFAVWRSCRSSCF